MTDDPIFRRAVIALVTVLTAFTLLTAWLAVTQWRIDRDRCTAEGGDWRLPGLCAHHIQ